MSSIAKGRKSEIVIAVIGLIAVVATAVISNRDELFAEGEVLHATYSGYQPSESFRTELRYYLELSGFRAKIEARAQEVAQDLMTDRFSEQLDDLDDAEEIEALMAVAHLEAITLDDMVRTMLPVYQEHFTLEELQDLNRFYSTEVMQRMVNKRLVAAEDAAPLQVALLTEFQERFEARLDSFLN